MSTVRQALAISVAENYSGIAISFVATLFLSRLLTPTEIGTFSIGVVLVGLAHIVRDFGVGRYIVQERELTVDRMRAAFAVTLTLAWSLSAILAAISVPVATYYRTPGVSNVMLVLAGNFLLLPFGSITMAFLRREMRFAEAFRIKVISSLVHAGTGVGLAALGFSYMSLAWASTAGILATVLGCAYYRPKEQPLLPGLKEISHVLKFGGFVSGAGLIGELGTAAPDLIIGRVLGVGPVAIFGRANGLIDIFQKMVTNSIWTVASPHFSQQLRKGSDLRPTYLRVVHYITGVAWPFYAFLAINAYSIVNILFGNQWGESIPLIQVLCISAVLLAFNTASTDFMLAHGEAKSVAVVSGIGVACKIAALLGAAHFGLIWVAAAVATVSIVTSLLPLKVMRRLAGITVSDLYRAGRGSLGVALTSCAGPMAVFAALGAEPRNVWLAISCSGGLAVLGWVGGLFLFKHQLAGELVNAAMLLRRLIRGRNGRENKKTHDRDKK